METPEVITKTKWVIDPAHSEISFKVKHLMFSNVRGRFREFDADISMTGNDLKSAEIDVRINAASVDTGVEQRDAHLRSDDFFAAEQFGEIRFIGNTIVPADRDGHFALFGTLAMRGVKKQVILDVEFGAFIKDPYGAEKALFSIDGKINRRDWGLNYNSALEAGGLVVGEDVTIHCEVQLIKQV
ncbi:MAG TPA: YceI family protein [Chryseolinea sp.]